MFSLLIKELLLPPPFAPSSLLVQFLFSPSTIQRINSSEAPDSMAGVNCTPANQILITVSKERRSARPVISSLLLSHSSLLPSKGGVLTDSLCPCILTPCITVCTETAALFDKPSGI